MNYLMNVFLVVMDTSFVLLAEMAEGEGRLRKRCLNSQEISHPLATHVMTLEAAGSLWTLPYQGR